MRRSLLCLAVLLSFSWPLASQAAGHPVAKPKAEQAFAQAQRSFLALKKDPRRRKFRDQWEAVAQRFEKVARRYPRSARAPEALFRVAELYAELSRVSLAKRDLRAAIEHYEDLSRRYPRTRLAGEAHLALGRIYRDRQGKTAQALAELSEAVGKGRGMASEQARAELVQLSRSLPASAAAAPGKPGPAAEEEDEEDEEGLAQAAPEAREEGAAKGERAFGGAGQVELHARDDEESAGGEKAAPVTIPLRGGLDPKRLRALAQASKGEVPLSAQVGLKVHRIVLDPGHGGHDSGAIGLRGLQEKEATLAIAQKLKGRLQTAGYEVLLTRDSDRFVSLDDRARFANRMKGDLFVSIHCNAAQNRRLRGTETYTLNVTSDRYAMRLAARENASSERGLFDLQFVLADLATRANTSESSRLAQGVQSELLAAQSQAKSPVRNLGVKHALFYVLLGARMPSVLVETAFISNPEDERRLADPEQQGLFAEAIYSGITRFTAEREAFASLGD